VTGKQKSGINLPFIPAKKLFFELRAEKEALAFLHKAFLKITSTSVFKQGNSAPEETPTNGYTLMDISIGGQIKVEDQYISVSFGATNILDKQYIDHLSTLKEVGFFNPGRNITMTLKIPFVIRKIE